jgi:hypothetical protein
MAEDLLADLLRACTVEVHDHGNVSTGFFVDARMLLAPLAPARSKPGGIEIRTPGSDVLRAARVSTVKKTGRVPPGVATDWTVHLIESDRADGQLWAEIEFALPEEGDFVLAARLSDAVDGRATNLDRLSSPYSVAALGLSTDPMGRGWCGAPVLNRRTARVCAIVVTYHHNGGGWYRILPLHRMERALKHLLRLTARTPENAQRWANARRLMQPPAEWVDEPDLAFGLYIPSERLYAAEASRLLALFREWLSATRGAAVRQAGYHTSAGEMIEFFAQGSQVAALDLPGQFGTFSNFLTLCSDNRKAAVALLADTVLGRVASIDLVDRFGREARRLEMDMRYERKRRALSLEQTLEEELLEQGVDLPALPNYGIAALVEGTMPGPATFAPLALLAAPMSNRPAQLNVHINQQFAETIESTIINSVAGNLNLAPQAKELLALIGRFGGQHAPTLQSAVYQLEDPDAPPAKRFAAKRRLQRFLAQVGGIAKDVGTDLLTKYLESKGL